VKLMSSNRKQTTREVILETLKATQHATVDELADAADVSPVTVRHHLNSLQADGLLVSASIRRKVGRPHYVYSLSDEGHELFPKKYARLSSRLLAQLKERYPSAVISEIFEGVVQSIVDEHRSEYEGLPLEKRMDYLVALLEEEGFLARWEKHEDEIRLIEYSCPYISVGQRHEEVCTFDRELVKAVVGAELEQHSCMLQGDACCQFTLVQPDAILTTEESRK
jgi:predicted ArsR family transcriptional regulator